MSEALFCIKCKFYSDRTSTGNCHRASEINLVDGSFFGAVYPCTKERGYDHEYLLRSVTMGHEICGVEGKFFEAKQ